MHSLISKFKFTLFLIFLLIFFSDFSSALVRGSRLGMGYPSAKRVLFSSSVSDNIPVVPFCKQYQQSNLCLLEQKD